MARIFRFVEKKRGQRRTGSNLVGSLGEAVFFGSLFLLGTISLSALVANQLLQPDPSSFTFGVGRWLFLMLMGSFVVLGGGGLIWTVLRVGTSAERRSALARRAADIDIGDSAPRPKSYPSVPPTEGLSNSPGVELAYRLPPKQTPGWRLLATTIFTLLWNFVGCMLTVSAIGSYIAGRQEWLLVLFLIPYWCVSTWSVRSLLQLIVLNTGMGNTTVEISELPLIPGREYQVFIAQDGHVTMKSLRLWLVCEEEATYTQGTDIRTEVREVYRQLCFEKRDFRIEPGVPFHDSATVLVPSTAIHSFHSQHNEIRWLLLVEGEAQDWPKFTRGFHVVVHPGQATMQIEVSRVVTRNAFKAPDPPTLTAEVRA
jgi:hypothetical protein